VINIGSFVSANPSCPDRAGHGEAVAVGGAGLGRNPGSLNGAHDDQIDALSGAVAGLGPGVNIFCA
jgi:hypothetical protein